MRSSQGPPPAVTSLADELRALDAGLRSGARQPQRWATGFSPLDGHLGGGLHAGDLVVLAGMPGTGKTAMALQMARNACAAGRTTVFVSFEHTPADLTDRLVAMEVGLVGARDAASRAEVVAALQRAQDGDGLERALAGLPGGPEAGEQVARYCDRMLLVAARPGTTDLRAVEEVVLEAGEPVLVVVDMLHHLHESASARGGPDETAEVAGALKGLAMRGGCPVLALAALDAEGLAARRVRARHLLGSQALAYEADVVLVLQDKLDVVTRDNLVFDLTAADEHRRWLVCTIEKNRRGRDRLDLEFRKRWGHGFLDPAGRMVAEILVDDRVRVD